MMSHATRRFWAAYGDLPKSVRDQADKAHILFRENPGHPSLRFKQVHPSRPFYSVRISLGYRVLAVRNGGDVLWFWIGDHAAYERLIADL